MQYDFEWVGIGGDDDQLSDTSVQSFSGFIGTLFDLLEGGTLGQQISEFWG